MSLNDSLLVVLQTIMSNGVGASVGLEAGYTQIGSALASRIGRSFRVRRNDLRLLVGCGAAGAIGGAFNAPLTGAFYAFELVIGTYSLATFAPVAVASIVAGRRGAWPRASDPFELELQVPPRIDAVDYIPILALGMLCALVGIAIMRGVTLTEAAVPPQRRAGLAAPGDRRRCRSARWRWSRPMVLSSGHGALGAVIEAPYTLTAYRPAGRAEGGRVGDLDRLRLPRRAVLRLAVPRRAGRQVLRRRASPSVSTAHARVAGGLRAGGMSGMAVAIIGGPLTMGFLALETTGSLPLTIAVLAACVVSSLTVRRTFGYSFATWRFHLRGEAIRSAVDIGWMRNLTVGRMMRREVRTVRADHAADGVPPRLPAGRDAARHRARTRTTPMPASC